jgi:hypothetical protein
MLAHRADDGALQSFEIRLIDGHGEPRWPGTAHPVMD